MSFRHTSQFRHHSTLSATLPLLLSVPFNHMGSMAHTTPRRPLRDVSNLTSTEQSRTLDQNRRNILSLSPEPGAALKPLIISSSPEPVATESSFGTTDSDDDLLDIQDMLHASYESGSHVSKPTTEVSAIPDTTSVPAVRQLLQSTCAGRQNEKQASVSAPSVSISPTTTLQNLRAVFVIARKSSPVRDSQIKALATRNEKLYEFFKCIVHEKLHSHCQQGCELEYVSLILNGYSSNQNISDSRKKEIQILRNKLNLLEREKGAKHNHVVLMVSGDDGFFTNVESLVGFFGHYKNIDIGLVIYLGDNQYMHYLVRDILEAIANIRDRKVKFEDKSQELVLSWIGISVNKEIIAQSNRDLKRLLPQKRNASAIDLPFDNASDVDMNINQVPNPKTVVSFSSQKRVLPMKHGLEEMDDGSSLCPLPDCSLSTATLQELVLHVLDHCRKAKKCVIRSVQVTNAFTAQFLTASGASILKYTKPLKEHVQRHLPPMFHCAEDACSRSFHTNPDLLQHQEGHSRSEVITCANGCGAEIVKTFLKKHLLQHCPSRDPERDTLIECSACSDQFSRLDMFYKHFRAAHQRRGEIIGFAAGSGLFQAGVPGLGLDVSAAIEASVRSSNDTSRAGRHGDIHNQEGKSKDEYSITRGKNVKIAGKEVGNAIRSLR